MRRISPIDAMFLNIETPATPSVIAGFFILDQSQVDGGYVRHRDVLQYVEDRLHLSPSLRQRLVFDPLNLDEPMMIDDENFDLEFHVRHLAVPQPRDMRQLNILASRIFSRPMDLNRPLWEMYVIEGLDNLEGYPDNCFAILFKLHHTAFDGVSAGTTIFSMLQRSPNGRPVAPVKRWVPERPPNAFERTVKIVNARVAKNVSTIASVPGLVTGAVKAARKEMKSGELRRKIPKTRFQGKVSSHRVCDWIALPMDQLHGARKRLGGIKVNDMALAIVSDTLRRYLGEKGELPDQDMTALCPINVRGSGNPMDGGNHVTMMRVGLATDQTDPLKRLQAIAEGSAHGKDVNSALGNSYATDLLAMFPYPIRASTLKAGARGMGSGWINPPGNTVVTNVPNPLGDYYFAGAQLVAYTGFGPVYDGQGLFHTVTSIESQLSISVTSCREMLPDIGRYMEHMQAAADDLLALQPPAPKRRKPAAKAKTSRKAKPNSRAKPKTARKTPAKRKSG